MLQTLPSFPSAVSTWPAWRRSMSLRNTTNPPHRPPPATCESCPWYELNPWTQYPTFGAWCHRQMEHLVVGRLACEEFHHGEVPPRKNLERIPQGQPSTSPAPQERAHLR